MSEKKIIGFFLLLILVVVVIALLSLLLPALEWTSPTVTLKEEVKFISLSPIEVVIKDEKSGLKRVNISLKREGVGYPLFEEEYSKPVTVKEKVISISLSPKKTDVKDGPATLVITAVDNSFWNFFKGNKTILEKDIIVDTTPPRVEVLSREHNINFGGSGLLIYRASEDTVRSGIRVGDYFFPGEKGYFKDPRIYMALFALPYNVDVGEKMKLVAEDEAKNPVEVGFFNRVREVRYREKTLEVSDDFIKRKMAPLLEDSVSPEESLKDIFLKVNRDLREKNESRIREIGKTSAKGILWNGAFHQLSNSQVNANFADFRTYVYGGEVIDHQYHLGYDLAVVRNYPIEAANSGVVVFAGDLGIYGNTVIIDHGLGLFTLYAHLSSIGVKVGDKVDKKQIIGRTGETGLAGGDHLHYAVLIYGVPVRPLEWWDRKWIKDHIIGKIKEVQKEVGIILEDAKTTPEKRLLPKR